MRRKPKPRGNSSGVEFRLTIEETQPQPCRNGTDTSDRTKQVIPLFDIRIRINQSLYLVFDRVNRIVVELNLVLPQLLGEGSIRNSIIGFAKQLLDGSSLVNQTPSLSIQ